MKLLPVIGGTIAVVGIVFVGHRLALHASEVREIAIEPKTYAVIAGASLAYAGIGVLLALSWERILAHLGGYLTLRQAIRIYGTSQIGKYIPGNLFHFAGRQMMGQAAGTPAGVMAKSSVLEIALISALAGSFIGLALPQLLGTPMWWGVVASIIIIVIELVVLGVIGSRLLAAGLFHLIYLVIAGLVFSALFEHLGGSAETLVVGAYVVSWLAGLLTPGAPAGIGVRELVLYTLLAHSADPSIIALAVLLGRVASVLGDTLFFAGSLILLREYVAAPSDDPPISG